MAIKPDKKVEVCSACLTAACWYGEFMCEEAINAGTVVKTVKELRRLNRESPTYWTNAKFYEVYGTPKPNFVISPATGG